MKNETDSKVSAYLRLAELCGTGDEERRKFYMKEVEKLLNPTPTVDCKNCKNRILCRTNHYFCSLITTNHRCYIPEGVCYEQII